MASTTLEVGYASHTVEILSATRFVLPCAWGLLEASRDRAHQPPSAASHHHHQPPEVRHTPGARRRVWCNKSQRGRASSESWNEYLPLRGRAGGDSFRIRGTYSIWTPDNLPAVGVGSRAVLGSGRKENALGVAPASARRVSNTADEVTFDRGVKRHAGLIFWLSQVNLTSQPMQSACRGKQIRRWKGYSATNPSSAVDAMGGLLRKGL